MCRDQNLISETSEQTNERASERMKIEKPGVGRPLLGPAKINYSANRYSDKYNTKPYFGDPKPLD